MEEGNDGSGWAMAIWPRHIDRTGQDSPRPPKDKWVPAKPKTKGKVKAEAKRAKTGITEDPSKFERALVAQIGEKAARAYIRRERAKKERKDAARSVLKRSNDDGKRT